MDVEIGAQCRIEPLDGARGSAMALVQHRLDGFKQRCARATELVLQCPVGSKQMTRQRTMPGARRTLVQRPDQVPAQARQAHRLRRPGLGQRLEPGQHALLRQRQARCPVPGCAGTSRASRTPPLRATRCAAPPPQSTPARARGGAAHRLRCRHTPTPRAACPSPPRTHRIARWPRRTRAAPASGRVWPCAGAPCRTRVSCPIAPTPLPRAQSPHSSFKQR